MRHSSKNAIPTKPQKQPAIAQNFHIKRRGGKKRERRGKKKGARERASEREVPVVAAVVLVCLPADEPQGSHGTFKARRKAREGGKRGETRKMREGREEVEWMAEEEEGESEGEEKEEARGSKDMRTVNRQEER